MSKPSWEDAPKWANYFAMDEDGNWWWFEEKPVAKDGYWFNNGAGRVEFVSTKNWRGTLEERT